MVTKLSPVNLVSGVRFREYYEVHKALGGLIKWREVIRTDRLQDELHITTDRPYKIFINGVLAPSKEEQRAE